MKKNSITEFELEEKDSKLRLKRGSSGGTPAVSSDEAPPLMSMTPAPMVSAAAPAAAAVNTGEIDIKSPMIGNILSFTLARSGVLRGYRLGSESGNGRLYHRSDEGYERDQSRGQRRHYAKRVGKREAGGIWPAVVQGSPN